MRLKVRHLHSKHAPLACLQTPHEQITHSHTYTHASTQTRLHSSLLFSSHDYLPPPIFINAQNSTGLQRTVCLECDYNAAAGSCSFSHICNSTEDREGKTHHERERRVKKKKKNREREERSVKRAIEERIREDVCREAIITQTKDTRRQCSFPFVDLVLQCCWLNFLLTVKLEMTS